MGLIHVYGKSEIRYVCLAPNVSEDASEVVDIKSGGQYSAQWQNIPQEEGGAAAGWWGMEGGGFTTGRGIY